MGVNLLKEPGRRLGRHGCVETKLVGLVRKSILQPVYETKATNEFVGGYGADVSMAVMMKFDSEIMLEQVPIRASLEWWAEAVRRQDGRTWQNGAVCITPVYVVFDANGWTVGGCGCLWCRHKHLGRILVDIVVVPTEAQGVFWTVEGFPYE